MNIFLLYIFRLTHIVAGILWTGAAVSYLFFFKPSVQSIGAAGPQFMQSLMERRKYPIFMIITSLLTVIAGGVLFWYSSGGFTLSWITSGPGLGYTIGALAALGAFFLGMFAIGPTAGKIGALGKEIAAGGSGPTPAQLNQMHALEKKMNGLENVEFILMAISLVAMATARYWTL